MSTVQIQPLRVRINGAEHVLTKYDPIAPLSHTLREVVGLRGTKVGCGQGNCGACTVHVRIPVKKESKDTPALGELRAVNSCLFPTGALLLNFPAEGAGSEPIIPEVTTIESVDPHDKIAKSIADCNGSQCGFCTPGIVMKAKAYQAEKAKNGSDDLCDIEDVLCGNLCRCTGYRPILYALKTSLASDADTKPELSRLKAEIEHTPACVIRNPETGNYDHTYANKGLESANVVIVRVPDSDEDADAPSSPTNPSPSPSNPASSMSDERALFSSAGRLGAPRASLASPVGAFDSPKIFLLKQEETKCQTSPITAIQKGIQKVVKEVINEAANVGLYMHNSKDFDLYNEPFLGAKRLVREKRTPSPTPAAAPTPKGPIKWICPTSESQVSERLIGNKGEVCVIAGNVNSSFIPLTGKTTVTSFMSLAGVDTLNKISVDEKNKYKLNIPANVTITQLIKFLKGDDYVTKEGKYVFENVINHLSTIGNPQVRNLGTVVGNLVASRQRGAPTDIGLIFSSMFEKKPEATESNAKIALQGVSKRGEKQKQTSFDVVRFLNKSEQYEDLSSFPTTNKKSDDPDRVVDLDARWVQSVSVILDPTVTFTRLGARPENHPAISALSCSTFKGKDGKTIYYRFVSVGTPYTGTQDVPPRPVLNTWTVSGANMTPADAFAKIPGVLEKYWTGKDAPRRMIYEGLSGRLLGINVSSGVQPSSNPTTLLAQRKQVGSQGSQKFPVDADSSPISEPIVKPAAYDQALGKAMYVQDKQPPANCWHGVYILAPNACLAFNPKSLKNWIANIVAKNMLGEGLSPNYKIFTSSDIDANSVQPQDTAENNAKKLFKANCNNTIAENDFDGMSANKYLGMFGEFIFAPGFTTYAGQSVAMILHQDEFESRRMAKIVQDAIELASKSDMSKITITYKEDSTGLQNAGISKDDIDRMTNVPEQSKNLFAFCDDPNVFLLSVEQSLEQVRLARKELRDKQVTSKRSAVLKSLTQAKKGTFKLGAFTPLSGNCTLARGDAEAYTPCGDSDDDEKDKTGERANWLNHFQPDAANPDIVIAQGTVKASSQTHLYMETQNALCIPEDDRMCVYASSQTITSLQGRISGLINRSNTDHPLAKYANSVVVQNVRIGGGFGGKEPQSAPTALASFVCSAILKAPVRVNIDRQTDFDMIGKRHAVLGAYKIAVNAKTGVITHMDLKYRGDAGCSHDCSAPVLELAALTSDNMYAVPNFRCSATPYLTHKQTGTAFRSFGVVQSMTILETAIEHAYFTLQQARKANPALQSTPIGDVSDFRSINFYPAPTKLEAPDEDGNEQFVYPTVPYRYSPETGKYTNFGQKLFEVGRMHGADGVWNKILTKGYTPEELMGKPSAEAGNYGYLKAVKDVEEFNNKNKYRKQGISLLPLKYGISFTKFNANQGSCNLSAYSNDGSVIVQTAGVEMGQGLHTKIAQTVSASLDIPMALIRLGPTSTDTAANGPGTGASVGADLNMPAVIEACEQLRERLIVSLDKTLFDVLSLVIQGSNAKVYNIILNEAANDSPTIARKRNDNWRSKCEQAYLSGVYCGRVKTPCSWDLIFTLEADPVAQFLKTMINTLLNPTAATGLTQDQSAAIRSLAKDITSVNRSALSVSSDWMKNGRRWRDMSAPTEASADRIKASKNNEDLWRNVCQNALNTRTPLLAQGFSKPNADGGEELNAQNLFFYYNYGAAWSQVEIDVLTGETDVIRTDIIYDAGMGTNAAADIGQIEGGFIQGLGNMLTESVTYEPTTGRLKERSIMAYAVPDHRSIPRFMNVELLWKNGEGGTQSQVSTQYNPTEEEKKRAVDIRNLKRGKTTGEPPLILSVSALNAVRNAIMAARIEFAEDKEKESKTFVAVNSPMTPQEVLNALWMKETKPGQYTFLPVGINRK